MPRCGVMVPMTDTGPLAVEYRHVPRLPAGSAESVAHLEEHGYVVVAEVLSTEPADHALDLLWDYLEELGLMVSTVANAESGDVFDRRVRLPTFRALVDCFR